MFSLKRFLENCPTWKQIALVSILATVQALITKMNSTNIVKFIFLLLSMGICIYLYTVLIYGLTYILNFFFNKVWLKKDYLKKHFVSVGVAATFMPLEKYDFFSQEYFAAFIFVGIYLHSSWFNLKYSKKSVPFWALMAIGSLFAFLLGYLSRVIYVIYLALTAAGLLKLKDLVF